MTDGFLGAFGDIQITVREFRCHSGLNRLDRPDGGWPL